MVAGSHTDGRTHILVSISRAWRVNRVRFTYQIYVVYLQYIPDVCGYMKYVYGYIIIRKNLS